MTRRTASLAFLALAVFAGPLRAQSSPRAIVETLLTAMSAKVAARIRKLFADTATQQYGVGALKSGEAFRAWIESDVIAAEARVDGASIVAAGDAVIVKGTIRNNRGYANAADFLFRVERGKIASWQIRY